MIFHHLGLFVADLEQGRTALAALLPITTFEPPVDDPGLRVRVQFGLDAGGLRYELVAPLGEGDPVTPVLASGKAILNHVAYRVPNLAAEAARLRQQGALPLGPARPAQAFDGRPVMFFLTPLRFILELIEDPA